MKTIYFIAGSQDLYGTEVLKQVAINSREMAEYIDERVHGTSISWKCVVRSSEEAEDILMQASADKGCVGVMVWMHTFSPAKMWIKGLQRLTKPLLHLHTQYNRELPYKTIDMDFMNLNQAAHGDREFGFICTRLGMNREVVAGYYKNESVLKRIQRFADVFRAMDYSHNLRVAMFGSNMRDVSVTDGDRVESEIRYGWNVNYYGVGDIVELVKTLKEEEIEDKLGYVVGYLNPDRSWGIR